MIRSRSRGIPVRNELIGSTSSLNIWCVIAWSRSPSNGSFPVSAGTTADFDMTLYYQINYRTYEPETNVESFTMKSLKKASSVVNSVQRMLTQNERTGLDNSTEDS